MQPADDPYPETRADGYRQHHAKDLRTRLTTWRERDILKRAMLAAGPRNTILDLPCGTGRFWPVFESLGVSRLIAADVSAGMLSVAGQAPPRIADFSIRQLDLLNLELEADSVDLVSCMRFIHHLSFEEDRMQVLTNLRRVTRSHVVLSLWTDGNLQSWRRGQRPLDTHRGYGRRICRPASEIETEFSRAGFVIEGHWDVWPRLAMWRFYLLNKLAR